MKTTALITGALSLVGVLVGSWISGHFQKESTEIDAAKSLRIACIQNSINREQKIRELTGDFFSEFSRAIVAFSRDTSTDDGYWKGYEGVQNAAFRLAAYAPPELSEKTIGVSFSILQALNDNTKEGQKKAIELAVNSAHDLPIEYENEMRNFQKNRKQCGR